jgi:hypothetical protein
VSSEVQLGNFQVSILWCPLPFLASRHKKQKLLPQKWAELVHGDGVLLLSHLGLTARKNQEWRVDSPDCSDITTT